MSTVAVSTALDREQLILTHLPQVHFLALRQHRRCPPEVLLEDLISIGTMGLIQAVDRYDPSRKLKLKTLAEHRIRGAMLDYLRRLDPLSRSVRQFERRREEALVRLQRRVPRTPAQSEIAAELKLSLVQYGLLNQAAQAGVVLSLDNMTSHDDVRSGRASDFHYEDADLRRELKSAIEHLPEPERTVIHAIRDGISICEIARRLHEPQSNVSRIKSNGIHRLRMTLGISPSSSGIHSER
jgi:RNA polymerase sigma factor for flagellar operon FliA